VITRASARSSVVIGLAIAVAACSSSSPTGGNPTAGSLASSASAAPSQAISTAAGPSPQSSPAAAATPSPIAVASKALEPALKQLWQTGGPKPLKDGGCCPVVAPDGNIWVSSEYDATFWIIAPSGKFLGSWGSPGSANGQFNFVGTGGAYGDVAFDPDGAFYVADTGNHRVQKFDKDRHFVKAWGSFGTDDGEFGTPGWIASDGHGHIWVADADRSDVQEFTSDGAYLRTVAADATIYFIATDTRSHVYIDDAQTVLVYDAEGNQLPGLDLSRVGAQASAMSFDSAGNLFVSAVSSYNTPIQPEGIYEIDPSGAVLHAWPDDADSIALDPRGGAIYTSFFTDAFIRKLALPKS
jgi:sugar lactone lactonase YvrE